MNIKHFVLFFSIITLPLTSYSGGCNRYLARINNKTDRVWAIKDYHLPHGRIVKKSDQIAVNDTGEILLDTANDFFAYEGPEMSVTYYDTKHPLRYFTLHLQQHFSFCLKGPGKIDSDVIRGNQYVQHLSDKPGSIHDHRGGQSDFVITVFD